MALQVYSEEMSKYPTFFDKNDQTWPDGTEKFQRKTDASIRPTWKFWNFLRTHCSIKEYILFRSMVSDSYNFRLVRYPLQRESIEVDKIPQIPPVLVEARSRSRPNGAKLVVRRRVTASEPYNVLYWGPEWIFDRFPHGEASQIGAVGHWSYLETSDGNNEEQIWAQIWMETKHY